MFTIELSKLRFHAYHGLYHEEKKLGGDFEVNVTVGGSYSILLLKETRVGEKIQEGEYRRK